MSKHRRLRPTQQARWLFLAAALAFASAGGLAGLLIGLSQSVKQHEASRFPPAFLISTALLVAGSVWLHRAVCEVRLEHQRGFRRSLVAALIAGTLFVGVQSWGLWWLTQQQGTRDAQTSANAFVLVLAVLHALHFSVALLFVVWITVRAAADRYDHEYYWGVSLCGYLWHALAVVWLVILAVLAIAIATQADRPIS